MTLRRGMPAGRSREIDRFGGGRKPEIAAVNAGGRCPLLRGGPGGSGGGGQRRAGRGPVARRRAASSARLPADGLSPGRDRAVAGDRQAHRRTEIVSGGWASRLRGRRAPPAGRLRRRKGRDRRSRLDRPQNIGAGVGA